MMSSSAKGYMIEHHREYWSGHESEEDANLTLGDICAIQRTSFTDGWNAALEVLKENMEFHDTLGHVKDDIEFLESN